MGSGKLFECAIAACLNLLVAACVFVPPPDVDVSEKEIQFLIPGSTNRDQVVQKLGTPNIVDAKYTAVYEWQSAPGFVVPVHWIALYPWWLGVGPTMDSNRSRVSIEFDAAHKVSRFVLAEYHPGDTTRYVVDGKPRALPSPDAMLARPGRSIHRGPVVDGLRDDALAVSRDGRYVANWFSSSGRDDVGVWDLLTGQYRIYAPRVEAGFFEDYSARSVAISADGNFVAAAPIAGATVVWNTKSGEQKVIAGHGESNDSAQRGATAIGFAPDGRRLATGGRDGSIKIWEVASGKELSSYRLGNYRIQSLDFAPQGDLLAAGTSRGELVVVSLREGLHIGLAKGSDAIEHGLDVVFSPSGETLAANNCVAVQLWHTDNIRQKIHQTGIASGSPLAKVLAEPAAALLLPYGKGGLIKNRYECRPIVAVSRDDKALIAISNSNSISLWDAPSRRLRYAWSSSVNIPKSLVSLTLGPGVPRLVWIEIKSETWYYTRTIQVVELNPIIRLSAQPESIRTRDMAPR